MTLAHAGHWFGSLAAVIPVLGVALWIGLTTLRDRRRKKKAR